jgi:hypothetical protein
VVSGMVWAWYWYGYWYGHTGVGQIDDAGNPRRLAVVADVLLAAPAPAVVSHWPQLLLQAESYRLPRSDPVLADMASCSLGSGEMAE